MGRGEGGGRGGYVAAPRVGVCCSHPNWSGVQHPDMDVIDFVPVLSMLQC